MEQIDCARLLFSNRRAATIDQSDDNPGGLRPESHGDWFQFDWSKDEPALDAAGWRQRMRLRGCRDGASESSMDKTTLKNYR
jgi:hypothetical protein